MDNPEYEFTSSPKIDKSKLDKFKLERADLEPMEPLEPLEYQEAERRRIEEREHRKFEPSERHEQDASERRRYEETEGHRYEETEHRYRETEYHEETDYQREETEYRREETEYQHDETERQVEPARARQDSSSFIETTDRLVLTMAVAMAGLWLLGHCVLWLIAGGASSGSQVASTSAAGPAVAQLSEKESEAVEEKTVEHKFESGDSESSQLQAQSEAPSAPPTETSYRPSYSNGEANVNSEDLEKPASGSFGRSDWEPQESVGSSEMVEMPSTSQEPGQFQFEVETDDASEETEFESDAGPIGEINVPADPELAAAKANIEACLLYTSPSPRDRG